MNEKEKKEKEKKNFWYAMKNYKRKMCYCFFKIK